MPESNDSTEESIICDEKNNGKKLKKLLDGEKKRDDGYTRLWETGQFEEEI